MKSFTDIIFEISRPEPIKYNDRYRFAFTYKGKSKDKEKVLLSEATLISRVGKKYISEVSEDQIILFPSTGYKASSVDFFFNEGEKSILITGAYLQIIFLADNGKKYTISYTNKLGEPAYLEDVSVSDMDEKDRKRYKEIFASEARKGQKHKHIFIKETKVEEAISTSAGNNADAALYVPGLKEYQEALVCERKFIQNKGGHKHKASNGKLIQKTKYKYTYLFDLESELFISDEAPVSIFINGASVAEGNVILCENFQIVIEVDTNIGTYVSSAQIGVEPWKLLDCISDRVARYANRRTSPIAYKLINEGPSLSTKDDIGTIPMGPKAVKKAALSKPITVVWGPPGTGKTHTMSEIAIECMDKGNKVLIVSHSNVSVDGVAKRISGLLSQSGRREEIRKGKLLRYGYIRDEELKNDKFVNSFSFAVNKCISLNTIVEELQEEYSRLCHTKGLGNPETISVRKKINKIQSDIRIEEQKYLDKASIIATTISKVVSDKYFEDKTYDVVMFDEISMAYVPQVICAATFTTKHLICVGDFLQLAPIAQSPEGKDVLSNDLFSFLGINERGKCFAHPWLVMLNEQRRMHPLIAGFSNTYLYKKLLKNHESTLKGKDYIVNKVPFEGQAASFIDTFGTYCAAGKDEGNSRYNILSAFVSFATGIKAEREYLRNSAISKEERAHSVSIISPYAAQTRLLRALEIDYRENKKETNIRCATVHQFQGSESNVVIFDAVESYPSKKVGWLMSKNDNGSIARLINVAVTRARGKFITVANGRFWNEMFEGTKHTFYLLLKYLIDKGHVCKHLDDQSLENYLSTLSIESGPAFYLDEKYRRYLSRDLKGAQKKIVISIPDGTIPPEEDFFSLINQARKRGVIVLSKTSDYENLPKRWKDISFESDNAIFPIVVIDDEIIWYGVPKSELKFTYKDKALKTVCKVVVRMQGRHSVEMVKSLTDLEYKATDAGKSMLLPKTATTKVITNSGKSIAGFEAFLLKKRKCPTCKQPLKMVKGKSGKWILFCSKDRNTELITTNEMNNYFDWNAVKCPLCGSMLTGLLGKNGIYAECDQGHTFDPNCI